MSYNALREYLKKRINENNAFVAFRLPEDSIIQLYYQEDTTLHTSSGLNATGFVMAPFDPIAVIPFIPNTHSKRFAISKKKNSSPQNISYSEKEEERDAYIKKVEEAKKEIALGKFQKVVLTRSVAGIPLKPLEELFLSLEQNYSRAMVYLFVHPKVGVWLGASPEQLISSNAEKYTTMALAATQLVQTSPPKWTEKEQIEQELVVHQIEKDLLQHYAQSEIEKGETHSRQAGHLVHLCTNFTFPKNQSPLSEIVKSLHPTPAVGGIPKKEAMTFIGKKEGLDRSFYTGFFGPITNDSTQLFVNLRCAQWFSEKVLLYVGAGITKDSDPQNEWEETQRKLKTVSG
jgi:isochorismate synthase